MPRNNRTGRSTGRIADTTSRPFPRSTQRSAVAPRSGPGQVRIVGGNWRGRKLHFPHTPSLRPTPDRVRETLFNWLQFEIAGRRCLDLFAGSGALGFEALSRGAAEVVFVEDDPAAAEAIRDSLRRLGCERARIEPRDAFSFLRCGSGGAPFDVVFVDPPYDERWLSRACTELEAGGWLAPGAFVYLEDEAGRGAPDLPAGWVLLRSKKAGDVGYHLARRETGGAASTPSRARGSA